MAKLHDEIRACLAQMSYSQLSQQMRVDDQTIRDWLNKNILPRRLDLRARVEKFFPGVFGLEIDETQSPLGIKVPKTAQLPDPAISDASLNLKLVMMLARSQIGPVLEMLQYFVFDCSPEERRAFRNVLGKSLDRLRSLTQAIGSETARELVLENNLKKEE